jgi:hypothetical protein
MTGVTRGIDVRPADEKFLKRWRLIRDRGLSRYILQRGATSGGAFGISFVVAGWLRTGTVDLIVATTTIVAFTATTMLVTPLVWQRSEGRYQRLMSELALNALE